MIRRRFEIWIPGSLKKASYLRQDTQKNGCFVHSPHRKQNFLVYPKSSRESGMIETMMKSSQFA